MSDATLRTVWRCSQATGGARLTLLTLADQASDSSPATELTVASIMRATGLSERAVQYAIRDLQRLGELLIEARPGKANRQTITLTDDGRDEPPPTLADGGLRNRRRSIRALSRLIWDRDGWTCQARLAGCTGHVSLTVGHIIPIAAGGTDDTGNLQTECVTCNTRKGAR